MNTGQLQFMPHGMCYLWNPQLLLLQVLSDGGIALAYFSIPLVLLFFVRKRRDLPFKGTFAMFGLFIVACGLTHIMGIWTIWHPAFWLDGALKAGTAIVSLATAAMLVPLVPKALALRSPSELEHLIARLEDDIGAREQIEQALRVSEERFRQVEKHAPIGLALVALDGSFTRVNPALCTLLGYGADELLAMTFQAITHPDDLNADLAHFEQTLDGSITGYEMEKRYFHKDGHTVWILLSASLVRDHVRAPSYFIAQIQDIGPRKAAEQAFEIAQKAALAAAEAKSRFLAVMSHEIRTPMNGIIGMTELLSSSQLSAEQDEYVKTVQESGRSLLRVLNDILDYSKIEAGKLDLESVSFDLSSQMRSVVSLLEPQFKTKGVSLLTSLDENVPATVMGDPGRVRQILINLVGNALKFTPAGGNVHVFVAAERRDDADISVHFKVVDTGVGIAPEVRHRLFQPFSQADGSTTRKYGGTGLGLSICKQLVDLMGGRIGVVSELGSGSSFWFTLPLRQGASVKRVLDAPAREMGDRRAALKPRSEKVLLAEDNHVNTLLALKQFKRLGFTVTVVANGREAVNAVRTERFDLVFMDCHMPEMDGFDATRQIRKLTPEGQTRVPIVAMTANAQADDREACLAVGMDDYVSKPVSLADLDAVLTRWLPQSAEDAQQGRRATTMGVPGSEPLQPRNVR